MDDQRRDRKIFGFTEDGPIAVEELEPVRILPAKSPLRKESAFVEDGVRLVPSLQGQVQFRFKISKRGNSLNIQNPESLKFTFFLEVLPAVSQPRSGRKVVSQIIFLFWRFEILSVKQGVKLQFNRILANIIMQKYTICPLFLNFAHIHVGVASKNCS